VGAAVPPPQPLLRANFDVDFSGKFVPTRHRTALKPMMSIIGYLR
jgi:hypothetical protein